MRFSILAASSIAAIAALAAPAGARLVSPGTSISWGKAGVSLVQYRADAIQCGEHAAATDLAGTDPARAFVIGSRMMENDPNVASVGAVDPTAGPSAAPDAVANTGATPNAMQMIGPQRQLAKAGDILESALERCLTSKGYRKFKLTSDQRRRLSKLPIGSDARHAYLHSLASDPDVLARQAVD